MPTLVFQRTNQINTKGGVFKYKNCSEVRDYTFTYSLDLAGPPIVNIGRSEGTCYEFTHNEYLFNWSVAVGIKRTCKVQTTFYGFVNWLNIHVERIGANITVFGGIIFLAGVAADAGVITLPAGLAANTVGGVLLALGGILWAGGFLLKEATVEATIVETETKQKSGSESVVHETHHAVPCDSNQDYLEVPPPGIGLPLSTIENNLVSKAISGL